MKDTKESHTVAIAQYEEEKKRTSDRIKNLTQEHKAEMNAKEAEMQALTTRYDAVVVSKDVAKAYTKKHAHVSVGTRVWLPLNRTG